MKKKQTAKKAKTAKRISIQHHSDVARCIDNPAAIADILEEYNAWRRGEDEYTWSEDPSMNKEFPYTMVELGIAVDAAIRILRGIK